MTRRRVVVTGLCSLLVTSALVGSGLSAPAVAAPPTPQQLAAADARLTQAQQALQAVQDAAENAAEAYNGAQVQAEAAAAASATATATAAAERTRSEQAAQSAAQAQSAARTAQEAADQAERERLAAVAAAEAAQRALDAVAAGAYRSGGNLALLSAMLDADPTGYATGRELINRADKHQRSSVDVLSAARAEAGAAATRATAAQLVATEHAQQVQSTADAAAAAAAEATAAADRARQALDASTAAAAAAATAKQRAQTAVTSAEAALGAASADKADLQAKAAQARAEAAALRARPAAKGVPVVADGSAVGIAIAAAYSQIGVPYAWGGGNAQGPTRGFAQGAGTIGFDCSGLTLYAYAHAGIRLDHFSRSQYNAGRRVSSYDDLLPGDLMFFATNTSDPGTIHHVAIYLGGDKLIEAPHTGDVVKVSNARRGDFIGGARLAG